MFPPKDGKILLENSEPLETLLRRAGLKTDSKKVIILADNNYYNGADTQLISSILASKLDPEKLAYAGWNTSGNTLGTAIPLGILRHLIKTNQQNLVQYKKLLWTRFAEDWVYMIEGREKIRADLKRRNLTDFSDNKTLETDYEQQMQNLFNLRGSLINKFLKTDYKVRKVFFPWHRPFEIGFEIAER